jgi:hypothetical protein
MNVHETDIGLAAREIRDIYILMSGLLTKLSYIRLTAFMCAAALTSGCMTAVSEPHGTAAFSRDVRHREYAAQRALRTVEANHQASMQALNSRLAASAAAAAIYRHSVTNIRR